MSRVRAATVRFYFDADVLGLAKIVASLRPDVTYPGDPGAVIHKRHRPACIVGSAATKDPVWIPSVTQQGWLIITRDARIQTRRAEIEAVREAGARMVCLTGEDTVGTWAQLEVVMTQWRRIEALLDQPGPFIQALTRTHIRPISLA